MKSMIHINNSSCHQGFIALVAIVVLAMGTFAFSISTMVSAIAYRDAVYTREMRIQKRLDQEACRVTFALMKVKDYFLTGDSNCGSL